MLRGEFAPVCSQDRSPSVPRCRDGPLVKCTSTWAKSTRLAPWPAKNPILIIRLKGVCATFGGRLLSGFPTMIYSIIAFYFGPSQGWHKCRRNRHDGPPPCPFVGRLRGPGRRFLRSEGGARPHFGRSSALTQTGRTPNFRPSRRSRWSAPFTVLFFKPGVAAGATPSLASEKSADVLAPQAPRRLGA